MKANGNRMGGAEVPATSTAAGAGEKVQAQSVEAAWVLILQVLGSAKGTLWKHQQIQVAASVIQRLVDTELAKAKGKKWSLQKATHET